uniref:Uncharacterized protein n=1 Tax=Panagrellus redivivus TaxID=6233 RepID=A0A7E4UTN2_PANRE
MNLNIAFFLFSIFISTALARNCPCFDEFPNCNTEPGRICTYTLDYDFKVTFARDPPGDVLYYIVSLGVQATNESKIPPDERILFYGTDQFDERNAALIFTCSKCESLWKLKKFTVSSFRAYILSVYALRLPQNYVYRMELNLLEQYVYFEPKMSNSPGKDYFEVSDVCYGRSATEHRHFHRPHFRDQAVCFIEHNMTSIMTNTFTLVQHYVDDGLLSEKPNLALSHVTRFGPPCRIILVPGEKKFDAILTCVCRTKECVDFTESKKKEAFCLNGAEFVLPENGKVTTYVRYQWIQKGESRCIPELTITPDKKVLAFRTAKASDKYVPNKSVFIFHNEGDSDISDGLPPQLTYINMTFVERNFMTVNKIVHWILQNEYINDVKDDGTCDNGNFFISPRFARTSKYENKVQSDSGRPFFPCFYEWSVFQNKRYYPVPMINAYPVRHLTLDGIKSTVFVGMRKNIDIQHREFDVYATLTYDDKDAKPSEATVNKVKKFYSICPKNINETHIVLNATSSLLLCGVYIEGIAWTGRGNVGWRPESVIFKPLEQKDLDEFGMKHRVNTIQCAFKRDNHEVTTMCTCPSEMGECHKIEYYAKMHTLRFGNISNQTSKNTRISWGFKHLRDWKRDYLKKHLSNL